MDLRSLDQSAGSPFIGNVVPRNGEFAVRAGMGLVRQFDTTLNTGRVGSATKYGLGPSIGTFASRTPFGHDQILTVHTILAFTGNYEGFDLFPQDSVAGTRARNIAGLALYVHDLHSGRHFEFVFHDQQAYTEELQGVLPHYATRFDEDHSRWFVPSETPTWVQFQPLLGRVLLCIDGCGVWTYRPVDAPFGPLRPVDSLDRVQLGPNMGETCALSPLEISDGIFADDETQYFTATTFGVPTAFCVLDNRVVYATGSTLLFSDPNRPDNIMAANVQFLPTQEEITCLAAVRGALFIATSAQCWVYQPATGEALVAAGQLVNVAQTIGCSAQRAFVPATYGVFFADRSGIYLYSGGVTLKHLSEEIDRFWTDSQGLQLPLTDYYQASGVTGLADPQPPSRIDVGGQSAKFRFSWDDVRKALYCGLDDVALNWTEGFGWSVWMWFSHAGAGATVQARSNLGKPSLVPVSQRLFLVAGPFRAIYNDALTDLTANDASCGLYEYGRGGGLDASTDATLEDERQPLGGWVRSSQIAPGVGPAFFLDRPIRLPAGYESPFGVRTFETFWLPVLLSKSLPGAANTFNLSFQFDNTRWRPLFIGVGNPEIDFVVPAERLGSAGGYSQGAPLAGVAEVQCYLGILADQLGNRVEISWRGAAPTPPYWKQPNMNLGFLGPDPILFLPFRFIGTDSSFSIPMLGVAASGDVAGFLADLYLWQEGDYPTERQDLDERNQPVDWVVKSTNLSLKGAEFKVRGVFITAMHLGSAAAKTVAGWPFGPLNSATSSDYRDFSAQAVDFTNVPPGNSESAPIQQQQRLSIPGAADNTPAVKVGNGTARWSSTAFPSTGNLLIDDAAVDTLATSDGSQGTRVSVMLHGTINAPGEGVRVGKLDAAVRPTGGKRRWFNR